MTAFVLCWPVEGRLYLYPWFWIPENNVYKRTRKDNVPYEAWVKRGFIETTPGDVTDWRFVTERIKQLSQQFDVRQIGFDRYGARDTVADLMDSGLNVEAIGQGPISFNAPMRRLAHSVKARTLVHSGHPVLRWNVDCTAVTMDANENLKPVKPNRQTSSRRIDGVVAAIMAVDCAMRAEGNGGMELTFL